MYLYKYRKIFECKNPVEKFLTLSPYCFGIIEAFAGLNATKSIGMLMKSNKLSKMDLLEFLMYYISYRVLEAVSGVLNLLLGCFVEIFISKKLMKELFTKYITAPVSIFRDMDPGILQYRLNDKVELSSTITNIFIYKLTPSLFSLVLLSFYLKKLLVFSVSSVSRIKIAGFILIAIIIEYINIRLRSMVSSNLENNNKICLEILHNYERIKAFGNEEVELERYKGFLEKNQLYRIISYSLAEILSTYYLLLSILISYMFFYGYRYLKLNTSEVSVLLIFSNRFLSIFNLTYENISKVLYQIMRNTKDTFLDIENNKYGSLQIDKFESEICFENVFFKYEKSVEIKELEKQAIVKYTNNKEEEDISIKDIAISSNELDSKLEHQKNISTKTYIDIVESNNSIGDISNPKYHLGGFESRRINIYQHYALKSVTTRIKKGETIAIVGKSGSGKTTFLYLMMGFIKRTSGKATIDGIDLDQISRRCLLDLYSYSPQVPNIFNKTLIENLCIGDINLTPEEIKRKCTGLGYEKEMKSIGYGKNLGHKGCHISWGQKKKICILRSLISNRDLILIDELRSLDRISQEKVHINLCKIHKNSENSKTIIAVVNDITMLKYYQKILFFRNGAVEDSGTLEELLNRSNSFMQYYYETKYSSS